MAWSAVDTVPTAGATAPQRRDRQTRRAWLLALAGLSGLGFLSLPFVGLFISTPWTQLQLQAGDVDSLKVSLLYTVEALLIVVAFGTPVAWWLARHTFRGKLLVELLVLLPLLTPPLAMGLLLSMSYGPYSWLGQPLGRLGLSLTNTPAAFLLAQIYGSAPYFIVAARSAFEGVPRELELISLTLGQSPWRTFWRVTVPLAGLGLGAGVALAWVRALGEFGIVLIVAYYPQGIPVKLWVNLQDTGLPAVYPLLWLFFVIGLPLPLILGALSRRKQDRR
ncbi:ABC transporter permease [Thiomonas sp.]|uniref:ABC transporter permease n=1 Tax=Thiomonas sp. TaxID=2047785 RepID=UPI002629EC29|nr:ABC transporter permease [Thiomonas sp.]